MSDAAVNKREILQPILDKIEPGWTIEEPDPLNPSNRSANCKFQRYEKSKDFREAFAQISNQLFESNDLACIERLVRNAIKNAKQRP